MRRDACSSSRSFIPAAVAVATRRWAVVPGCAAVELQQSVKDQDCAVAVARRWAMDRSQWAVEQ